LETAPPRISNSPGFFKCRFCDDRPVCHLKAAPAINCRTCQFSKPISEGKWWCNRHSMGLPNEKQQVGCPDWHVNQEF
jgi:hypothetical protein